VSSATEHTIAPPNQAAAAGAIAPDEPAEARVRPTTDPAVPSAQAHAAAPGAPESGRADRAAPPEARARALRVLIVLACAGVLALAWQWWARPALHTGGDGPSPLAPPWPDMRLNLNTATIAELTALPEIGEATAIRIIEDREAHGPFDSVDHLDRVPGIGARTLERLREFVVAE
jgi:competence protein ComEA